MARKWGEGREHIVSIRLNDQELHQLKVRADLDGVTPSEALRRLLRREFTPPLACGESVGARQRLIETSAGVLSPEGITWCTGQGGRNAHARIDTRTVVRQGEPPFVRD